MYFCTDEHSRKEELVVESTAAVQVEVLLQLPLVGAVSIPQRKK